MSDKDKSTDKNNNNHKSKTAGETRQIPKQHEQAKEDESILKTITETKNVIIGVIILFLAVGYPLILKHYYSKTDYSDCADYFRNGFRDDGIYEIKPFERENIRFNVFCNMTAGGWTVIMKRSAATRNIIDFQRPMSIYKNGFGDLNSDHFLGLDYINYLTRERDRQLLTMLNATQYRYNRFKVLDEFYHYKLIIADEIDKFSDGSSFLRLNNTLFSTIDVDYDMAANSNCSSGWNAGWWFTNCFDLSICMPCLIMHGSEGVKQIEFAAMMIK